MEDTLSPKRPKWEDTACVEVSGSKYYTDGDIHILPRVKFLVPSAWLSDLTKTTRVIFLALCVDGTDTEDAIESDICAAINALPGDERKLLKTLRVRKCVSEAIMLDQAIERMAWTNVAEVTVREQEKNTRTYLYGEKLALFKQKCFEIARQEAQCLAKTSPEQFLANCEEIDTDIFSTIFRPVGTQVALPDTVPDLCVVYNYVSVQ